MALATPVCVKLVTLESAKITPQKILIAASLFATPGLVFAESVPSARGGQACEPAHTAPGPDQPGIEALQAGILAQFKLKGFKCDAPSAKTGLTCIGRIKGYPRDVLIAVPPGYQLRERAEIVLHLHGHNYTDFGATYLNQHFGLATGLAKSHRDAILIAPLSYGNCADFEQSLVDKAEHFKGFIDESMTLLQEAKLTEKAEPKALVLTGHSGAYRSIAKILDSGVYADKLRELYVFDSTYGLADTFASFAAKPENRFWSAHADPAVVTVAQSIQLKLAERQVPFFTGQALKSVTSDTLDQNRIGFVRSGAGHEATFFKYYPVFLGQKP